MKKQPAQNGGFTLIELMVSLAIFAFMTAFLLVKYGTFNQSTLLTNLAFDTALTIRNAQSYGLNVQGTTASSCQTGYSSGNICFYYPYGVDFTTTYPNTFVLFTDLNASGRYSTSSNPTEAVSTYNMNKGYAIQSICAGSSALMCAPMSALDITFKRPDPDAIIDSTPLVGEAITNQAYAQIVLTANNATTTVVVRSTGEISVGGN